MNCQIFGLAFGMLTRTGGNRPVAPSYPKRGNGEIIINRVYPQTRRQRGQTLGNRNSKSVHLAL